MIIKMFITIKSMKLSDKHNKCSKKFISLKTIATVYSTRENYSNYFATITILQ